MNQQITLVSTSIQFLKLKRIQSAKKSQNQKPNQKLALNQVLILKNKTMKKISKVINAP